MNGKVLYPGSFDPVTMGHLSVIQRALALFDEVHVVVFVHPDKPGLFSVVERLAFLHEALSETPRVQIDQSQELTVEYATRHDLTAIVRGLRTGADFDYELPMARMNHHLRPDIHTVFLLADKDHVGLSSSLVKEIARYGADVTGLVPPGVARALRARYAAGGPDGAGTRPGETNGCRGTH